MYPNELNTRNTTLKNKGALRKPIIAGQNGLNESLSEENMKLANRLRNASANVTKDMVSKTQSLRHLKTNWKKI